MDALPAALVEKVKRGEVNLDDPATTLALIKLDAVLGVKGTFNQDGSLKTVGLSCAVCHSTVDDAFMPGIGHRLDGWPNRDLNCAQCHVPPLFTEPGWNAHKAAEIGIDEFQANRSPDNLYRTAPLRGLFTHMKGGFYHDGRLRRCSTWSTTTTISRN